MYHLLYCPRRFARAHYKGLYMFSLKIELNSLISPMTVEERGMEANVFLFSALFLRFSAIRYNKFGFEVFFLSPFPNPSKITTVMTWIIEKHACNIERNPLQLNAFEIIIYSGDNTDRPSVCFVLFPRGAGGRWRECDLLRTRIKKEHGIIRGTPGRFLMVAGDSQCGKGGTEGRGCQ